MGTTTNRSYPYPASSAAPNVPSDMQALATAIDTDVNTLFLRSASMVIKSNGTTRTSTNTPAVDSGTGTTLSGISLVPGSYLIEFMGLFTCAAASVGLRTQWSFSGTYGSPTRFCFGPGASNSAASDSITPVTMRGQGVGTSVDYGTSNSGTFYALMERAVAVVTVTGNLGLSWSQVTSSTSGTSLQAGSFFRIHRYA